jgi:hypothetical protein
MRGGWRGRKRVQNDARRVVWTLLVSFLSFLSLFWLLTNIYIDSNLRNTLQENERRAEMTKTGPNDARRVVWTHLVSFLSFFRFFLVTN